jgi:hypothetical protein
MECTLTRRHEHNPHQNTMTGHQCRRHGKTSGIYLTARINRGTLSTTLNVMVTTRRDRAQNAIVANTTFHSAPRSSSRIANVRGAHPEKTRLELTKAAPAAAEAATTAAETTAETPTNAAETAAEAPTKVAATAVEAAAPTRRPTAATPRHPELRLHDRSRTHPRKPGRGPEPADAIATPPRRHPKNDAAHHPLPVQQARRNADATQAVHPVHSPIPAGLST